MTDYYPFGSERNSTVDGKYSWGFQGMMKDDEWKGDGKVYTTEFRQYDSQIGRWKSVDKLGARYPGESSYSAYGNNPIYFTDPTGLIKDGVYKSDNDGSEIHVEGDRYTDGKGNVLAGFEKVVVTEDLLKGWFSYSNDIQKESAGVIDLNGDGIADGVTLNGNVESESGYITKNLPIFNNLFAEASAYNYHFQGGGWANSQSGGIDIIGRVALGEGKIIAGSDESNITASGELLSANANVQSIYFSGRNSQYGGMLKAGAIAKVAEGTVSAGLKGKYGMVYAKGGGCALCIGADGGVTVLYNPDTREVRAALLGDVAVILGLEGEIDVIVNWGNVKDDVLNLFDF